MQLDHTFDQEPLFNSNFSPTEEETIQSIPPDFNMEIDPEEMARIDEINEILQSEEISGNVALNILINAVQVCYDKDIFNDLDKYLVAKAFDCFKRHIDRNEDLVIKVN